MVDKDDKLQNEAKAFSAQISERISMGHIPDLRLTKRCEYFYNNVWRDPVFVEMSFGEIFNTIVASINAHSFSQTPKILEVGCGPGHISLELARNGFNVIGIDISEQCIAIANEYSEKIPYKSQRGNLQYIYNDFFLINETNFDVVLFVHSMHHFSDTQKVCEKVKSLLKTKGIVIVNEPTADRMNFTNAVVIFLIRYLLSIGNHWYREFTEEADVRKEIRSIYEEFKMIGEDGSKLQSINDNEAGFKQMYDSLANNFVELEFYNTQAFFKQIIGGLRFKTRNEEYRYAKLIKSLDKT